MNNPKYKVKRRKNNSLTDVNTNTNKRVDKKQLILVFDALA